MSVTLILIFYVLLCLFRKGRLFHFFDNFLLFFLPFLIYGVWCIVLFDHSNVWIPKQTNRETDTRQIVFFRLVPPLDHCLLTVILFQVILILQAYLAPISFHLNLMKYRLLTRRTLILSCLRRNLIRWPKSSPHRHSKTKNRFQQILQFVQVRFCFMKPEKYHLITVICLSVDN